MPTISVTIPAYNATRTISATLDSILKQTFSDFEIIVINDGSTDNTVEKVQEFQDPRIKIFSYENGGIVAALNRALTHARGEYIAFMDADDLWTPDKLELQLKALQDYPEAGVAYSWTTDFIDGKEDQQLPDKPMYFSGDVLPQLLVSNFLRHGSNVLVRRSAIDVIGELDPIASPAEDWDYYLRLAAQYPFALVPKHQIFYRQSTTSLSSNVSRMEKAGIYVIEKAYKTAPAKYQHLQKQSLAILFEYCAQRYIQCSQDRPGINQAGKKLWQAVTVYPQTIGTQYFQRLVLGFAKRWVSRHLFSLSNS